MVPKWILILSTITFYFQGIGSLRLGSLVIPSYTLRGQPVRLECHYDLEGEALYSVKWYFNSMELYRFLPEDDPPSQVFSIPGLSVDLPNSSDTTLVLKHVELEATGMYKCEVSGEAPSFKTVSKSHQMIVVAIPDSGPYISGSRPRYHIGESVSVNCSSSKSYPAARLMWFINGDQAEEEYVHYHPTIREEDDFEISSLGLEFKVKKKHFKKGDMKIKCLATIPQVYWRSNEESVEEDRPQKASSVLESRETYGKREASSDSANSRSTLKSIPLIVILTILTQSISYYYLLVFADATR